MALEAERAVRIRLMGRRWKLSFIADLASELSRVYGPGATVRINSFISQRAGIPLTDLDLIGVDPSTASKARRLVEDVLEKHGYPLGRLLAVKPVEVRLQQAEEA